MILHTPRALGFALLLSIGTAAAAQTDPMAPQAAPPSPANAAANVAERPVTQQLNNAVSTNLAVQAEITAEQQGNYAIDRAQYRAAVEKNARQMTRDMVRYDRQQDAYARAMIVWRVQTDECKRGILKSCKKPTPVPADFY